MVKNTTRARASTVVCRSATGRERPRSHGGFTSLELLVTVAIVAILAVVAAPSLGKTIAQQKAKAAASELLASLLRARSEAVLRNTNVTLSPATGGWQQGWQIKDPATSTTLLDNHGANSGLTIAGPATVTFNPSGRVTGSAAPMFLLNSIANPTGSVQCISVDLGGRPYRMAATTC